MRTPRVFRVLIGCALVAVIALPVAPALAGIPAGRYAIGDSVMLGARDDLIARGFRVNAQISRQFRDVAPLVRELSEDGVQINVTALFTTAQVELITAALKDGAPSYVSVFAGRIADAGIDPLAIMSKSLDVLSEAPRSELIWASPREILNVVQADQIGCHIITLTQDLLPKLDSLGKDLDQFSLETVQMFHRDAHNAGFVL